MVAAAIVASAAVGAGSAYASSKASKDAAQRAARTAKKGTDASIAEQQRQFDEMMRITQPRRDAENTALGQLLNVLGLGQDAIDPSSITIPGQDFAINEAQRAIERSAAARGGLASGNTLAALQDRAQGIASQNYLSHYLNPLMSLGLGSANASAGQSALQVGVNVGNTINSGAVNRANILGQNNSPWNGINDVAQGSLSNYLMADYLGML